MIVRRGAFSAHSHVPRGSRWGEAAAGARWREKEMKSGDVEILNNWRLTFRCRVAGVLDLHLKGMEQPSDSTVKPCEFNNRIVHEGGLLQMREMCYSFKGDGKTYATKLFSLKSGSKFACPGCWNELQKYRTLFCAITVRLIAFRWSALFDMSNGPF